MIGYNVNQYEAPIVTAHLTDAEIDALKNNPNVAAVEDDGPCYVMGQGAGPQPGGLVVEGQPSQQAETIPCVCLSDQSTDGLELLTRKRRQGGGVGHGD